METTDDGHPSTIFARPRTTLAPAGKAHTRQRRRPRSWSSLRRWNRRIPLPMTLEYVGGSEPWVRVKARGEVGYIDMCCSVDELLRRVCNEPYDGMER